MRAPWSGRQHCSRKVSQNVDVSGSSLLSLEGQQRYCSHRAILVAIVSQNSFVLVVMGCRTIIARYIAKWGIAQMRLCETKYQGGGIAPCWGVPTSL